jgi:uncharacterized protein YbaP (TraB family)
MHKHGTWKVTAALGFFLVCQATQLLAQQAPEKTSTKHSLWKVHGKTNAVYLFGSIHFLKKEFYPLPKPIEDAYKQSQVVVFETNLDEVQNPQTQLKMLQQGQYPEGETLKKNLSKDTYAKLQEYLAESAGGLGAIFEPLRPWMVAVTLLGLELQRLGFDPQHGADNYFHKKAKQDEKQIVPLETVDLQLSFFTGLSSEEQDAMLKETLQEIGGFKSVLEDLIAAWKAGDTKKLDGFILDTMRQYPRLHKKLLIDRNQEWLAKIEKLHSEGRNVFVVVGAAHLVGKDSVVDLLSKKGLKVEQM